MPPLTLPASKEQTMTEPTNKELDAVITHYRTRIYPQDMQPHFERAIMRAVLAKWGTPQPTQPQAEATPHCPDCGTHEVSIHKVCHNSACSKYGAEVTVHEGWKTPPKAQPATACRQRPIAYVDGDDAVRRILWEPNQAAFDIAVGTKLYAYQSPADAVDAERYRWLRRWKGQEHEPPFTVQHEIDGTLWGGDLDAAIDAERASHGQAPAQAAPAAVAGPSEFPHEQMDVMALARYKVMPSHESMLHRHVVVAGDGSQQLYIGREAECENMARKFAGAFLDGAFAFHLMLADAPTTQPAPGEQNESAYQRGYMDGMAKGRRDVKAAPQQEAQDPCPTCAALARTVMLDQVSFDRKPNCYGIRQITDDEGVEEWEDIRTSPDVAREEANYMMATGRGEIYEVVPLWTTPQPEPQPSPAAQGGCAGCGIRGCAQAALWVQRYSFVLDDDGLIRRVQDRVGNWIEFDDAHELFDPVAIDAARAAQEGK